MRPIRTATRKIAGNAQEHRTLSRSTRTSTPYEFENLALGTLRHRSDVQALRSTRGASVVRLALGHWNTWRRKVVASVASGIHEFWSSIILSHAKRQTMSVVSLPTVLVGEPRNFVRRFVNAVLSAQTAIDCIPSPNRSIMPTMMYRPPCKESTNDTTFESRAILKAIEEGDIEGVSFAEYLQVSFLALMSGEEVHMDQKIMYGGNLYTLHACVEQINPNQQVEALRKVI